MGVKRYSPQDLDRMENEELVDDVIHSSPPSSTFLSFMSQFGSIHRRASGQGALFTRGDGRHNRGNGNSE